MAQNIYKYTTVGLAGVVGLGIAVYTAAFIMPMMTAATNNQPNALENIPDGWAVWTWDNGQDEANYRSLAKNCTINVSKYNLSEQPVVVNMSLICEHEKGGSIHIFQSDNQGGGNHLFITEPADFDFVQPVVDVCDVSLEYKSDKRHENAENIEISFDCQKWE